MNQNHIGMCKDKVRAIKALFESFQYFTHNELKIVRI